MDTNQWPEGLGLLKPIENPKPAAALERKPRPQKEQALNCPRCNSTNTKFCYYNNYNLSQPRYFCKTCRRYWTEGGTLRNVPVGGGSRKNKRSSTSSSSSSPASVLKKLPDLSHLTTAQNPKIIHEGQDLNLAYPPTGDYGSSLSALIQLPNYNNENKSLDPSNPRNYSSSSSHMPASLELLKSSGISPRGFSSLLSMPLSDSNNSIYSSVIPMPHDFKPKFNFSLDGYDNGYASLQESNSARLFFPYEDLKPLSLTSHQYEQNKGQDAGESTGYWNGMLGSGGSW